MNAPRVPRRRVDGVLLLDKPQGLSSNAALQRARRALRAEKAGHTGTLDPLASGLLPLCFGEATKFAQYLLDATKCYRGTIRFGATTTTGDAEGELLASAPVDLDRAAVAAACARFVGPLKQVPPRHSALKYQGRAYYDYARAGIDIPREARDVLVESIVLVSWEAPDAVIDVVCSKGTYVRVLAEDIGAAAGCGAHLAALRRTRTGGFDLSQAIALDAFEAMPEPERDAVLLPADVLVAALPRVDLAAEESSRFLHGAAVAAPARIADGPCAVFGAGRLLGVADVEGRLAKPRRVRADAPSSTP